VCGAFGISIGTGKILCGTNTSVTSGGTFATVNQWAKFLLHSDSNAYLLDYI
jgi:hypothetical protein